MSKKGIDPRRFMETGLLGDICDGFYGEFCAIGVSQMHLIDHVSSSASSAHHLSTLIGDTAQIVLFLALAHFAYGVLHMLVDALSERQDRFSKYSRRICKATIDALIYLMAGLYGLEYLVMKMGNSI